VTSKVPTAIAATSDSTLFASFREDGLSYKFDGRWHPLLHGLFDTVSAGNDNSFMADVESHSGNSIIIDQNGRFGTISHELSPQIGNDGTTFIYDLGGPTWLHAGGNRSVRIRAGEAVAFA
jgi:hypothetical protein